MSLLSNNISVSNIFKNMSLAEEPVALKSAQEWLQKNNNGFEKYLYKFNKSNPQSESGESVQKFIDLLEETRSASVGLLVKLKYTWNDANKIMDMFLSFLKSDMIERKLNPTWFKDAGCYSSKLSFVEECRDIARSLVKEICVVKCYRKSDPLLPFYAFLVELCEKAGLTGKFTILLDEEIIVHDEYFKNLGSPLIITEDADIDSAVESVAQSLCQFNREVSWSVSHVIIQESVFDFTVKQLESRLKKIKHGSRLDKNTELEYDQSLANETHKNLKIFKSHEKSPLKLCIGWNPKDVDKADMFKKSNGYVIVIPYRNTPELQTLVKNLGYCLSGSVWSEKNSVKKLASKLNFLTSWTNCHGAYHPLVPLIRLPNIGDDLWRNTIPSTFDDSSKKRFPSAMLSAIKGYKEMQKLNGEAQILFTLLVQNLLRKYRKEICNQDPEVELDMSNLKSLIEKNHKISSSVIDIATSNSPIGVIIINLFEPPNQNNNNKLICLILSCIYNGNAVVINTKDSATELENLLKKDIMDVIPKGIINFTKNFDDNTEESLKLITKEIKTIPCPLLAKSIVSTSPDQAMLSFYGNVCLSNSLFVNFQKLMHLTKLSKTFWTA